tara:strand:+ start:567 stop:938 length:372 start_codon:yes stop_codon:yes gene_type:complete
MFGNIFKKLIPLAATAGIAYMAGSGASGGSLFGSTNLKEKLMSYAKKEAIKRGTDAIFGGGGDDDNFVSPYSSASVNFDKYMQDIGASSKSGVVNFPGNIKTADTSSISYAWQQRMNSYIGRA